VPRVPSLGQLLRSLIATVAGLTPLKDASKKEPTAPAAPPSEVDEIKADVKGLRDSLGRMGKSIGAIVTAVVAAVGYTQIHDIFPFPAGEPLWLRALAIGAAAAGLGASAFLVVRFFFAQRRILIESDLSRRWRWHVDWNEAVEQTHKSAWSEGAPTLYDLDRRSIRLDRIARRLETTTDDDSQRLGDASRKEADRLGSVVTRELWRAAEHILERRTRGAFGGPLASLAILLAVFGVGFTFAIADWSKGKRSLPEQRIREAAACVERAKKEAGLSDAERAKLAKACVQKARAALGVTETAPSGTTGTTGPTGTTGTTGSTTAGG
jgi:hypothetical protein